MNCVEYKRQYFNILIGEMHEKINNKNFFYDLAFGFDS